MRYLGLAFILCIATGVAGQQSPGCNALEAISDLHRGWLVVRLPDFDKKLYVIDSLLQIPSLSDGGRHTLERERDITLKEKKRIYVCYPFAFEEHFTFSKVAFIDASETKDFIEGRVPARNAQGDPLDSVSTADYIFATLSTRLGGPIHLECKALKEIERQIPNDVFHRGIVSIPVILPPKPFVLGGVTIILRESTIANNHVERLDKRLTRFYLKKIR